MAGDAWTPPQSAVERRYVDLGSLTWVVAVQQTAYWLLLLGVMRIPNGGADASSDGPTFTDVVGLVIFLFGVGGALAWGTWHHRAAENLVALGRPGRYPPIAHALWWFVPVANLVMPFRTTEELVRGSDPDPLDAARTATTLASMPWWWVSWIMCWLLVPAVRAVASLEQEAQLTTTVDVIVVGSRLLHTVLYVRMIREIARHQAEVAAARQAAS